MGTQSSFRSDLLDFRDLWSRVPECVSWSSGPVTFASCRPARTTPKRDDFLPFFAIKDQWFSYWEWSPWLSHSLSSHPWQEKTHTHTFLTSSWRWSQDIPKNSDTPSDKEVIISSAHFSWRNPNLTGVSFNYQSDIMPHRGTLAKNVQIHSISFLQTWICMGHGVVAGYQS